MPKKRRAKVKKVNSQQFPDVLARVSLLGVIEGVAFGDSVRACSTKRTRPWLSVEEAGMMDGSDTKDGFV